MAEKVIKHLGFWYMEEVEDRYHPDTTYWVERTATQGETVDLQREADVQRGEEAGAFFTDEELEAGANLPVETPEVSAESEAVVTEVDSIRNMSDEELEAWIREDKPTVREVVDAAEGDPELASRLLDAEDAATNGDSRAGVINGLTTVINQGA